MNNTDIKVMEYLDRAKSIMIAIKNGGSNLAVSDADWLKTCIGIAKMIQYEEKHK